MNNALCCIECECHIIHISYNISLISYLSLCIFTSSIIIYSARFFVFFMSFIVCSQTTSYWNRQTKYITNTLDSFSTIRSHSNIQIFIQPNSGYLELLTLKRELSPKSRSKVVSTVLKLFNTGPQDSPLKCCSYYDSFFSEVVHSERTFAWATAPKDHSEREVWLDYWIMHLSRAIFG